MVKELVFGTVGGLGLFLYGMTQMSDGLKKVAGQKLKNILESMTKRRIVGFLVGAGVTALIQSSSAATVMIVGFVNAGLLTLKQAISVIIGTNVGTTATALLVSISGSEAFKITDYALPAVAIGFGMQLFGRRRTIKDVGQILVGFGILFIGISFMKEAFKPLEGNAQVHAALIWFARYGWCCNNHDASKQFSVDSNDSDAGGIRGLRQRLGKCSFGSNPFYSRRQYRDNNHSTIGVSSDKHKRAQGGVGPHDV